MADPKASSVSEMPAAMTAPPIIARQPMPKPERVGTSTTPGDLISVHAEERKDGHNHNDQSNEIDDSVHDELRLVSYLDER
jgi:hypothetical protein